MKYYTEEITKIPFRSLCRALASAVPKPAAFVLAVFFRARVFLNWNLSATHGVAFLDGEQDIDFGEFPPRAISRWAPLEEQLIDLGFKPIRYQVSQTVGAKLHATVTYLDQPGLTVATLEWIRMPAAEGFAENTPLEFSSYAEKDPEYTTAGMSEADLPLGDLLHIEFIDYVSFPLSQPVRKTYESHLSRIRNQPVYQMSPDRAIEVHRQRSRRRMDHVLGVGLLRELSEAEVLRLQTQGAPGLLE